MVQGTAASCSREDLRAAYATEPLPPRQTQRLPLTLMSSSSILVTDAPGGTPPATTPEPARFAVHAWTPGLRGLAVVTQLAALGALLHFTAQLWMEISEGTQRMQPVPIAIGLVLRVVLPLAFVSALRRSRRATVGVDTHQWTLTLRGGARMEIPFEAVAAVRPWRLPLPGPGLALRMRSGRAFSHALEVEDALPLLNALGQHGALGAAQSHTLVRYAQARHALWRRRWYHLLVKFVFFPLVPTAILFYSYQVISFGGALGEYRMYGLDAYLRSFGRYYAPISLCLLLFACFWRVVAEGASLLAAWLLPAWARGVRRAAEWFCWLVYYVGTLGLIGARFMM
ncbi:hypothetical protein BHS07_00585 [Myxococcus xanthus]|uniref:Uncharacterized protein n=2 Tax=Myxococcus xanthus TaxID=34 RepID=A0AAE6FUW6_MYXXA|nr:hypothetical protein BHS09_00595 [Myxococcus xanthus]QDE72898.1 hypothetical protein BHS08_00595 [Myxococcus xanthus]QDE80177.1 hypothetical protein BHS07_00585 [Myxococcus xanthus]QDE94493.1 hypothetical protein BHS05_00605 [Myxococcus xanthus]QDF01718.1 hypothetical protein BHS04_00595 [Myxococcus xanthus]